MSAIARIVPTSVGFGIGIALYAHAVNMSMDDFIVHWFCITAGFAYGVLRP